MDPGTRVKRMSDFDVYHQWLGIPPDQRPPTHYQLLGVAPFECDLDVIRSAAERQAQHVRRRARGEFVEIGQDLLNEIVDAKLCLINESRREAYNLSISNTEPAEAQSTAPAPATDSDDSARDEGIKGTLEEITPASVKAIYINITPNEPGAPAKNRWVIGYHPKCDFCIDSPVISGVHCQIQYSPSGLKIADLSSTNGTYVNQKRIRSPQTVHRQDLITLGRDNRILLPGHLMASTDSRVAIFVGAGLGNEIQLDSKTVSLFHARILFDGTDAIVEDLNSRNGTFLSRGDAKPIRIQRCRLHCDDVVYFGSMSVQGSRLLAACGAG